MVSQLRLVPRAESARCGRSLIRIYLAASNDGSPGQTCGFAIEPHLAHGSRLSQRVDLLLLGSGLRDLRN